MNYRPIAIDLFAGCGGFSLGLEQSGFDIVSAIDLNPIHCATYKYNFSNTSVICKDITSSNGDEVRRISGIDNKDIDLVFGGSPCQGCSLIGKRNIEDSRNDLMFHFIRLVKELQPSYFIFENVKGLALGKYKQLLLKVIETFKLNNYDIVESYKIVNAASYGVPQNRERLFLLGCKKGLKLPSYPLAMTSCPIVWDAIADLPEVEHYPELLNQDWLMTPEYGKPSYYAGQLRGLFSVEDDYSYPRIYDPRLLTSSLRTEHSVDVIERFKATEQGKVEPISRFLKLHPQSICNTLRAGTPRNKGSFTAPRPIHPFAPRVITVREAARLHSYPDWFRFHVTKIHGFRQLGNSVPPLLGKAVGAEIIKALNFTPSKPTTVLELGDEKLLSFDMSKAANHFGVDPCVIEKRIRKTGIF